MKTSLLFILVFLVASCSNTNKNTTFTANIIDDNICGIKIQKIQKSNFLQISNYLNKNVQTDDAEHIWIRSKCDIFEYNIVNYDYDQRKKKSDYSPAEIEFYYEVKNNNQKMENLKLFFTQISKNTDLNPPQVNDIIDKIIHLDIEQSVIIKLSSTILNQAAISFRRIKTEKRDFYFICISFMKTK